MKGQHMANAPQQVQQRGLLAWINNLNWIAWFVIVTLIMYWVWNPITWAPSAYKIVVESDISIPLRVLAVAFTGVLIWLIYRATKGSIGHSGVIVMIVLIGVIIWAAEDQGWMSVTNASIWQWLVQPIVGLIGATGIYWPRLRKAASGTGTTMQTNEVVLDDSPHDHR